MIIVNDVAINTIEDLLCILEPTTIDMHFDTDGDTFEEIHAAVWSEDEIKKHIDLLEPWLEIHYSDGQQDAFSIFSVEQRRDKTREQHRATMADVVEIARNWFEHNRPTQPILVTIKTDPTLAYMPTPLEIAKAELEQVGKEMQLAFQRGLDTR